MPYGLSFNAPMLLTELVEEPEKTPAEEQTAEEPDKIGHRNSPLFKFNPAAPLERRGGNDPDMVRIAKRRDRALWTGLRDSNS